MEGHLQNIFMEHDLYLISSWFFCIKEKLIILTHTMHYDWFCAPGSHIFLNINKYFYYYYNNSADKFISPKIVSKGF